MPGMHEGDVMADEHKSKDVSLSLPRDDWAWLFISCDVAVKLASYELTRDSIRHLKAQFYSHKAAQAAGTATDAATVVLDGMKILDPPEPIAGGSR